MKKIYCLLLCVVLAGNVFAYDFSSVAPSGQTLYYSFITGGVCVSSPGVIGNLTIPSSVSYGGNTYMVTSICESAFLGSAGLTSVTIPNSVTSIGNYAFYQCSGLTSVSIPNSVTSIGEAAFLGCSGLTGTLTIPNSVTSIGSSAFGGCSGVTYVDFTGTIAQWCGIDFGDYNSNPTRYSHVLSINGSPLTNLVIPEGVTNIGNYAFYHCSGLTSVSIPNSVTNIGNYAFYQCSGLTSVSIPNSVTNIGNYAFYQCSYLTSVSIPNSVTSIGNYAFYQCSGLTSVTTGNSVTSIGQYAFYGCTGVASVTIGNSVTSIGGEAFHNCSSLTEIHSDANIAPLLGTNCFANVSINIPVYIPCGSQMSYYSRWSYFSNFVEAAGFSFSATSADDAMGSVTVLTQPTCQSPTAVINAIAASGYQFQQWDNGVTDNPYSLVVTSDTALSAIFVASADTPCDTVYIYIHDTVYIHDTIYITGEGIDGADAMNAKVYTNRGQVVVEGADGHAVALYDVNGRLLATKQDDYGTALHFDVTASGTYMIKIGHYPARKVVVIR